MRSAVKLVPPIGLTVDPSEQESAEPIVDEHLGDAPSRARRDRACCQRHAWRKLDRQVGMLRGRERDLFADESATLTRPIWKQRSGRIRGVGRRPAGALPGRCRAAADVTGWQKDAGPCRLSATVGREQRAGIGAGADAGRGFLAVFRGCHGFAVLVRLA